jgi:hypothetical protein
VRANWNEKGERNRRRREPPSECASRIEFCFHRDVMPPREVSMSSAIIDVAPLFGAFELRCQQYPF